MNHLKEIIATLMTRGADHAQVIEEKQQRLDLYLSEDSASCSRGRIEREEISIEVIQDGRAAVGYTTDLTITGIEQCISQTLGLVKHAPKGDISCYPSPQQAGHVTHLPPIPPFDRYLPVLENLHQDWKKRLDATNTATLKSAILRQRYSRRSLCNSSDLCRSEEKCAIEWGLELSGADINKAGFRLTGGGLLPYTWSPERLEHTLKLTCARQEFHGTLPQTIVFSPRVTFQLLMQPLYYFVHHPLLSHELKSKLHESINLSFAPNSAALSDASTFDRFGFALTATHLIRNGIPLPIHKPSEVGCSSSQKTGTLGLTLAPCEPGFNQWVAEEGRSLEVVEFSGTVRPEEGSFSGITGVNFVHEKNGSLFWVRPLAIRGNLLELTKSIRQVLNMSEAIDGLALASAVTVALSGVEVKAL